MEAGQEWTISKVATRSRRMLEPDNLKALAEWLGVAKWPAPILLLIGYALFFPEKFDNHRSWIMRQFSRVTGMLQRKAHAESIRSAMNPEIRQLRGELGLEQELPEIVVRFASTDETNRTEFAKGHVIVFLRQGIRNVAENKVRAAVHYVGSAIAPDVRPYLSEPTNRAMNMVIAKRLLKTDLDAMRYFVRLFIDDECKSDAVLRTLYNEVDAIDIDGLLPAVLLHTLTRLATELPPTLRHDKGVQSEVVSFITFLSRIASRDADVVTYDFAHRFIQLKILPIARTQTLRRKGLAPHVRLVRMAHNRGIRSVYVLAAGTKAGLVREFIRKIEASEYFAPRIEQITVEEARVHYHGRVSNRLVGHIRLAPR